jgi:hypothetical protein
MARHVDRTESDEEIPRNLSRVETPTGKNSPYIIVQFLQSLIQKFEK